MTEYRNNLEKGFKDCVAIVADPDPLLVVNLGTPSCKDILPPNNIVCLLSGRLDVKCTVDSIDFESNSGSCTEALHQPPSTTRQACEIEGGLVEIADATGSVTAVILGGAVTTTLFDCGEALCTFMLEDLALRVEDIDWGSDDLTDLSVELHTAAFGRSDGEDVEFSPGSVWARVMGNVVGPTAHVPFDGVADNVMTAYGTHDGDILTLDDVVFQAGGYTFTASIDPSDCVDL